MSARDSPFVVRARQVRFVVAGLASAAQAVLSHPGVARATGLATSSSSAINDTASTRRIQLMAAGLVALAVALIAITVWFWKSTRPDPESLAPLEMMGRKKWRKSDAIEQRHRLDDVRAHVNDKEAQKAREVLASGATAPPSSALAQLASTDAETSTDAVENAPGGDDVQQVHGDPLVRALENDPSSS